MSAPVIASVQVGLPRWHGTPGANGPKDRPWHTGFWKEPVAGPVRVTALGLVGDGVADTASHGGPDKAVLAYSAAHYSGWRVELGFPALPFGGFGENLTVRGLTEDGVCVGDVWRAGGVVFDVSQPREPCWKLARRWNVRDLPARVIETGRSGWYLRVLAEGDVEAGAAFMLAERPNPEWSVARANRVMHVHKYDADESAALAALPGLSASWRESLLRRA